MNTLIMSFSHYLLDVIPAVLIGFLLSGIIYEVIPHGLVERYLGKKGIVPILFATLVGAFLPICCWGSLPVAVSFYKKGAKLGPVLAFLIATPATSVSALLVTYRLLGPSFAIYAFFGVVFMGIISGLVGNSLAYTPRPLQKETCPHCHTETTAGDPHKHSRTPARLVFDVLKYAFWEMPKELGLEILIGIALAAVVSSFFPVGYFIKHYLSGWLGYLFSVVVGVFMYVCSTASVPLVHAFVRQGLSAGAGMVLLLLGPITSYGTMLVLKKEFGARILIVYLILVITLSLALGIGYQYFFSLPMAAQ